MGGKIFSDTQLNNILTKIIEILIKYEIPDWFIAYGTLLGIIRNNSCINNDDDIDIIIDINQKEKIYKIISDYNYKTIVNNKTVCKIEIIQDQPTVDFYFSTVNIKDEFHDTWNKLIWTDVKPFITKEWNNVILVLPNNYEKKLENIYGNDWMLPKKRGEYYGARKQNKIIV